MEKTSPRQFHNCRPTQRIKNALLPLIDLQQSATHHNGMVFRRAETHVVNSTSGGRIGEDVDTLTEETAAALVLTEIAVDFMAQTGSHFKE